MKKIRRNFIVIAMLSMFLVLTIIITALNYINYQKMGKNLDDVTHILEMEVFMNLRIRPTRTTTLPDTPPMIIPRKRITKCRNHPKAYRKKPLIKHVTLPCAMMLPAQYMQPPSATSRQ